LSARISAQLKAKLEAEAEKRGVTISDVAEDFLSRVFDIERERENLFQVFGGRQKYALCRLIAGMAQEVEVTSGAKLDQSSWAFAQFLAGVNRFLKILRPKGESKRPSIKHLSPEEVDRLGESAALHQIAAVSLADASLSHWPGTREDHPLRNYPSLKSDLGKLGEDI
jgi:hypothetical protein